MRILALDLGNTKSVAGLFDAGSVRDTLRRERRGASASHPLAELYDWCRQRIAEAPIAGVIASSVVPDSLRLFRSLWEKGDATRELPLQVVGHETAFPFAVDIQQPQTVGPDRWCNVAGAMARGLRSALVVDLGTANTYDLLLDSRFVGGIIAPGLQSSHDALIAAGALLPEIELQPAEMLIGRHTQEAIQSGSWYQGLGGVEATVGRIREQTPQLPVLLTGGMGARLAPHLRMEFELISHLTLEGAASLFTPTS